MPRNLYADVETFRDRFVGGETLDIGDGKGVERVLEAAARRIDEVCHRHFYSLTETKVLAGCGRDYIWIPDLMAATTIKLDEDRDRTFELTLAAATDYYLVRSGFENPDATPKTKLVLDGTNGSRGTFIGYLRLVEIVGRWGFTENVERLTATGSLADATTTALTLSAEEDLSVGQTLLIASEQLYVIEGSGTAWTVRRGMNGTTAATHATVVIDRYVYIPEVREAAVIIAGRMWKRRETAFANVITNPVAGTFEAFRRTDPDVAALLAPLVRGDMLI